METSSFELLADGEWVKGHWEKSQYGQMFVSTGRGSVIITGEHSARVVSPLVMDRQFRN